MTCCTAFVDGMPAGVIGARSLLDGTGVPFYARGWDHDAGSLDAQGCLVAPLR